MKYDLYPIMIDKLFEIYSLEDDKDISTLYKYLNIRCGIIFGKKKFEDRDLINFIISELNVDTFEESDKGLSFPYLEYKGKEYYNYIWSSDFLENFRFQAGMKSNICYKTIEEEIYTKGYRRAVKFRDLMNYKDYIKYYRLMKLNEVFGAIPTYSMGIDGFKERGNHNPYKRTSEEELLAILDSSEMIENNTTTHISEEDLEDYLFENIELIEDGLTVLGRQIEIEGGIIDILARDSHGVICVIELKINEDKSIIWQALHYPEEIMKRYRVENVRMITVTPKYSKHIYDVLLGFEHVEMLEYKISVKDKKIRTLKIGKVDID